MIGRGIARQSRLGCFQQITFVAHPPSGRRAPSIGSSRGDLPVQGFRPSEHSGLVALRVVELFAGVGGFRLALEEPEFKTVWSNQWEPGERAQWASRCYVKHFPEGVHANVDIATVDERSIPKHDLLVGGFPCQDYSVATTKAKGIQGKKGVLWWEIDRIVRAKKPPYILLENVDRLLRSPTSQRGRDFGVVLKCLTDAGYHVEWRALNAADYGFPQKRRRVFIFAARNGTAWGRFMAKGSRYHSYLQKTGFFARTFPIREDAARLTEGREPDVVLPEDIQSVSDGFAFHFLNSGVATRGKIWTYKAHPRGEPVVTLESILAKDVPQEYFVPDGDLPRWKYLKGAKAERREAANGHQYRYSEGAIPFPDRVDQPARTILTHEGARSPSRFNHIILDPQVQGYRRLTPEEAEQLNGFPPGWTAGMPERRRFFMMGNALVVGLVKRMGRTLSESRLDSSAGAHAELHVSERVRIPRAIRARVEVEGQKI